MKWQPIETAPKNKHILVFATGKPDWDSRVPETAIFEAIWEPEDEDGENWWYGYDCQIQETMVDFGGWTPTHWMPLPEPPK